MVLKWRTIALFVSLTAAAFGCGPRLRYRMPSEASTGGVPPAATAEHGDGAGTLRNSDDGELSAAIRRAVAGEGALATERIDVTSRDGVATCSGRATSRFVADRVVASAEATRGVIAVIDRIEIDAPFVADRSIGDALDDLLASDPATAGVSIDARVRNGEVTLTGAVESLAERRIAGELAWSLRGVSAVENRLSPSESLERSDAEIQRDVARRLAIDARLHDQQIAVLVENGAVLLTGSVRSAFDKRRARERAEVAGVRAVNDEGLAVAPWSRRTFTPRALSDVQVSAALKDSLRHDPRLDGARLSARARRGTVTLSGAVGNLRSRLAAGHDAIDTVGVWEVENALQVRPEHDARDQVLGEKARERLRRDALLSGENVEIEVVAGRVLLQGEVPSRHHRTQAELAVAGIPGVVGLDNRLTTYRSQATPRDDQTVRDEIETRLLWDARLDASEIEVDVHEGVAFLRGDVAHRAAYDAVLEAAMAARPREIVSGLRREASSD